MTHKRFLLLLLVGLLFSTGVPVQAHGYIVRAVPQDRAVLARVPPRVQYWFSETLEARFSSVRVRDQHGTFVAEGGVDPENNTLMTARLSQDLPDGAYIVEMRVAFASDGHVITETRVFFVGQEVGGVSSSGGSTEAVALEVLWRAVLYASTSLLLGVFVLYSLVLVPAWGSRQYPAGLLPPRVMLRLNRIVWGALLLAFTTNLLALIQQTMQVFSVDAVNAVTQGLWQVVRTGSRFGDVWNARMLLLGLMAALHAGSLYFRQEQPRAVRAFWVANLWLGLLVIGASSVASHAAGSPVLPWAGVFVNWAHALAVGFWIGGLATFVLVLPVALRPYSGDARRLALLAALRRFSRLAAGSLGVVIASGIYNALNWYTMPADITTSYGGAQILKTVFVIALVGVGAVHHVALHPERFARFEALGRWAGNFGASLRLEAVLALCVLTAAGLLSATPPPQPESTTVDAPRAAQTAGAYTVNMTLSPGGPGINTLDIVISRDGQQTDGLLVDFQFMNPARDWRSAPVPAEGAGEGLYVIVSDEIDTNGTWWTVLDVRDSQQAASAQRVAFAWAITAAASVSAGRPPSVLNLVALAGVVGSLIAAFYPQLQAGYRRLNLTSASATIVLMAAVGAVVTLAVGYVYLQDLQRQSALERNPPPQIVNPTLPDAASLARGAVLYTEHCAAWEQYPDTLRELRERLPRTRDETLFAYTRDGWRELPACAGELSDLERWDIVNAVRASDVSG